MKCIYIYSNHFLSTCLTYFWLSHFCPYILSPFFWTFTAPVFELCLSWSRGGRNSASGSQCHGGERKGIGNAACATWVEAWQSFWAVDSTGGGVESCHVFEILRECSWLCRFKAIPPQLYYYNILPPLQVSFWLLAVADPPPSDWFGITEMIEKENFIQEYPKSIRFRIAGVHRKGITAKECAHWSVIGLCRDEHNEWHFCTGATVPFTRACIPCEGWQLNQLTCDDEVVGKMSTWSGWVFVRWSFRCSSLRIIWLPAWLQLWGIWLAGYGRALIYDYLNYIVHFKKIMYMHDL